MYILRLRANYLICIKKRQNSLEALTSFAAACSNFVTANKKKLNFLTWADLTLGSSIREIWEVYMKYSLWKTASKSCHTSIDSIMHQSILRGGINISVKCPALGAILKANPLPPGFSRHCAYMYRTHWHVSHGEVFKVAYHSNTYYEKKKKKNMKQITACTEGILKQSPKGKNWTLRTHTQYIRVLLWSWPQLFEDWITLSSG